MARSTLILLPATVLSGLVIPGLSGLVAPSGLTLARVRGELPIFIVGVRWELIDGCRSELRTTRRKEACCVDP